MEFKRSGEEKKKGEVKKEEDNMEMEKELRRRE